MNFEDLKGMVLTQVDVTYDEIVLHTADRKFKLYHPQDCCESVYINDVVGEWSDLIGNPLLVAEESSSDVNPEGVTMEYQEVFEWTFYKFATIKGSVDIRWYGESNGYYSTSVHLEEVK